MEDISFYQLPENYKLIIDMIENSIIRRVYSKYSFSYNSSFKEKDNNDQSSNLNRSKAICTLSEYLKNCQFVTYQFRKNNNDFDSSDYDKRIQNSIDISKINAIFCFESQNLNYEGQCLIIDDINFSTIQAIINDLKRKEIALIDCNNNFENSSINEEINSFCTCFLHEIRINKFVKRSIRPIICYLIRSHFYPSNFFKNRSFFTYMQPKKQKENEIKKKSF